MPSIKATGFQPAADDVNRLIDSGRLNREEVEARLLPADLAFLDKAHAATTWVPIETYRRVVEILVDLESGGNAPGYLHGRGQRAAERLHKMGVYRQFEASSEAWGKRAGKVSTTLASVIYNFTKWTYEAVEPGTFRIVVDEAREFPEVCRFTAQGTMEYTSCTLSKSNVRVTSERATPDRIVYTGKRGK